MNNISFKGENNTINKHIIMAIKKVGQNLDILASAFYYECQVQ